MWLGATPEGFYPDPLAMSQFSNPAQFSVGSNKFGVLEITERRQIAPTFIDMMGFTPVCHILLALSLVSLTQPDRPALQLYRFDINSSAYAQDAFKKSAYISLFQV